MKQLVLTGATGNFGAELGERLKLFDGRVILLIRAKSRKDALQRVHELVPRIEKNIEIIPADLTRPRMGMDKEDYVGLSRETTHVLHSAAATRFTLPLLEARKYNVQTTKHMLIFAKDCSGLEHFGYMSTAFVAGKRIGRVFESELIHTAGFLNTYEQSKQEAESLVTGYRQVLPISIYRPSFLVTNMKKKGVLSALTFIINAAKQSMVPLLPGSLMSTIDLLPASFAAETIIKLFLTPSTIGKTYHITAGEKAVTVSDIITAVETYTKKKLAIRFIPDEEAYRKELTRISRFRPDMRILYKKLNTFVPELCYPKLFDTTNTVTHIQDYRIPSFSLKTLIF